MLENFVRFWRITGYGALVVLIAGCQTTPGYPVMPGAAQMGECWIGCRSLLQAELPECLTDKKVRKYFFNSVVEALGDLDTSSYPDNACGCATMELAEGGRFQNFRVIETNVPQHMQAAKDLVESFKPDKPPPDDVNCMIGKIWPVTLSD